MTTDTTKLLNDLEKKSQAAMLNLTIIEQHVLIETQPDCPHCRLITTMGMIAEVENALFALAKWALEAREELEKIAKPALGGKEQQQRARTVLDTFPKLP